MGGRDEVLGPKSLWSVCYLASFIVVLFLRKMNVSRSLTWPFLGGTCVAFPIPRGISTIYFSAYQIRVNGDNLYLATRAAQGITRVTDTPSLRIYNIW